MSMDNLRISGWSLCAQVKTDATKKDAGGSGFGSSSQRLQYPLIKEYE